MELDEAVKKVETKISNFLNIDELEQMLQAHHSGNTQRAAHASRGVQLIREGLAALASLGHQFDIVPKQPSPPLAFPKMLYRQDRGEIVEMTVESQLDLDEALGDGWSESPSGTPVPSKVGKK